MSAHTLATQPHLGGHYRARPKPAIAPASIDASHQVTMAVRLTGASMRVLEVSLAVVAIATALLAGVGR